MPTSVGKVMLLGDTHANLRWTAFAIDQAAKLEVDGILQLGDFGYWPRTHFGKAFLDSVEQVLADHALPLWFIDGNHEDHESLGSALTPPDGLTAISDHVTYLPRGATWVWGGTRWMALGGAASVDRDYRQEDVDWFRAEVITPDQYETISELGPVNVVVAHDAPWGVPFLVKQYQLWRPAAQRGEWPAGALRDSDAHMQQMAYLAGQLHPRVWFHGHHHVAYHDELIVGEHTMDVYSLDCDGCGNLAEASLIVDGTGAVIPPSKL